MTRTKPSVLILLFVIGAAAGWLLEMMLVSSGRPSLVPPVTLGIGVALIGVLIVLLALPVYRVVRRVAGAHVDPFYATRIVLLAKASSLTGAIVTGVSAAVVAFLLTRSVVAAAGSLGMAIATLVGSVLLLAGGLVAEKMCTLPPEDDGPGGAQRPGAPDRAAT